MAVSAFVLIATVWTQLSTKLFFLKHQDVHLQEVKICHIFVCVGI